MRRAPRIPIIEFAGFGPLILAEKWGWKQSKQSL